MPDVESARSGETPSPAQGIHDLTKSQRRLIVSFLPMGWQALVGAPLILHYGVYFFQLAGVIDAFIPTLLSQ